MKNFKLFKMLAVLTVLITSINTAWAGSWFATGMWQVYGYNPSTKANDWHWTGIGYGNHCEVGVITSSTPAYTFKGLGVNTSGSDVDGVHCKIIGPDREWWDWVNWNKNTGSNKYWEKTNMFDYTIDKSAAAGNYSIGIDFYLYEADNSSDYDKIYGAIKWTISGFAAGAQSSQSFGTAPKGSESVATISFTHYGNALTTGNCSLSNSTDFEVRSINESGVTVVFKPQSNGTKTSTLTINDGSGMTYSTISITLTGTGGTSGTVTRLYFNDYRYAGAGDWAASSAKYRFSCTYTSGVITYYNMEKYTNTEHTYYADVDIRDGKNVTIDRYDPNPPYGMWNCVTPSTPALSSTNPYAKSTTIDGAYATNHPYNDVTGGTVYYDNSKSEITNTLYLIVGHDHNIANNNSDAYSSGYAMTNITNTKMYYHTFSATTWHDADYYGVIGATSDPTEDHNWSSSSLASKGSTRGYTAAYNNLFGLLSGSTYLATAPSKTGGALSFSQNPTLSTTQTFNYALSTDGGSSYPALTSSVNTPGQLKLESYYFSSATAVTKNTDQILSANATTYTKAVSNVAYTGTTVLTESSTRDGYSFIGWYEGNTLLTASAGEKSYTYYPRENKTYTARYKAHRYTINFDANDAQYSSAPAATGSMDPMTNVVYDQSTTLPSNGFHRIGYKFDGWATTADGLSVDYTDEATAVLNLTTTDGGSVTLYAKWSTDVNTFTNETGNGNWNDPDNWSDKVVPTNSYAAVQLSGELNVSSYIHVGSMDLTASGAKLTIQAGGTLEVAGAITNTNPDKLVIQTGNEGQGALIYDITQTAPHAIVNMTTKNAAGSHYQYIASPIGGVSVADVFSGKGAYTYVWKEGIGWERRGYYDDIAAFEPIALKGKGSCSFVGQLYPGTTSLSLSYTGTPTNADAQGVNMLANALTAPIKIAAMTITGSPDGAVHVWNNGEWEEHAVASAGENVIPAMQVYAILASSSGTVSFDYETAVRGASDKNAALKAPKRIASDIPEHITISVRTNERDIDLQLYEDEMFTNEIDKGWEAIYMEGDGRFGELYAQADEKMSILATPDLEGTILGFAPGETSDYTISFNGDGKGYYLNDMKELKSTLISEGNTYMFSPDESTNATRFVISRTPIHKVPTGTENVSAGTNARKQMINGTLYIIRDGRIYNAEGALVK